MTSRLVAGLLVMMSLAPLRVARCEPPPDSPSALRPGTVLGSENWEAAKGLLPEEFLEAYRRGDLRHEIGSWEPPKLGEEPTFAAALKENEDRFDLDDEGSIINRRTGKAARDITAWPFPKIDRADPKVALKIVWNYFYTLYYGGNGHYRADLAWISRHGLDRSISVDAFHKDYEWKLIGEQDLLVLFDRPSFEQKAQLTRLPEGGWRMVVPGGARVGFQVPDWKGAPWCPIQEVLIRRPHWIIEAVPKDRYYLYGKIIFRFDKDIYLGSYSSKYDWKGKLLNSYVAIRTNIIPVAPGELWGWAGGAVALAVNWKLDRATTAGIVVGTDLPADSRIPLDADLFSLQEIQSRGKEPPRDSTRPARALTARPALFSR